MKEIAISTFLLQFKSEMIQFQGFVSFVLLAFWISAIRKQLIEKMIASRVESIWVFCCLGFGLFIGTVSALEWGTEYLLLAFALGLSIGLAMCHSAIAVCVFTSLVFLRPWELIETDDYFLILPKLTFCICLAHVLLVCAAKKSLSLFWSRSASLVIAFAVWCFLTTFKAADPIWSQASYFEGLFKSVFLYLMVMNALKTREDLNVIMGTVALTFIAVGVISIYQTVGMSQAQFGEPVRLMGIGSFANSNDIAALMVLAFPFGLMAAIRKNNPWMIRAFSVFGMFVGVYSIYLSQSRAAMMALAVSICLLAVLKIRNKTLTAVFCGLALLSVPVYMAKSSRDSNDLDQSSSSRITYLKTGVMMGLKNPVMGVGYNGYPLNFESYATEIVFEWGYRTAHNSWILVFAETGLLGLILFVALFVRNLKDAFKVFNEAPELLLSLVGYGITMSFLSHSYGFYIFMLYGFIGVALRIQSTNEGRAATEFDLLPSPATVSHLAQEAT
jgi:O-antigen ligase